LNPVIELDLLSNPEILQIESVESDFDKEDCVSLVHRGTFRIGGESFRLISRNGDSEWSGMRLEKDRISANFQGSPLWPQKALEDFPNLIAFFNLKSCSSDRSCILPMDSVINHRLRALDIQGFSFKRRDSEISCEEYVDSFLAQGVLPMAPLVDRNSIHDWSYHFVTFLIPEYLESVQANLKWIRDRISLYSGLTNYSWNYYGHTLDDQGKMISFGIQEEMTYRDAIYRQMAVSLDVATAKIVQLLLLERTGHIKNCRTELLSVAIFMSGVHSDAIRKILWMEKDFPFDLPDPFDFEKVNPMEFIYSKLAKTDLKAKKFIDESPRFDYQPIFKEILAKLDHDHLEGKKLSL
tara:strand:- start:2571 stop:3626 length:1056 start_codon:yes stop_codon:yes gene_type:complete